MDDLADQYPAVALEPVPHGTGERGVGVVTPLGGPERQGAQSAVNPANRGRTMWSEHGSNPTPSAAGLRLRTPRWFANTTGASWGRFVAP